jgi:hypothetical protein
VRKGEKISRWEKWRKEREYNSKKRKYKTGWEIREERRKCEEQNSRDV